MNNCLKVKNLWKHYPDFSLENVNFSVPTGCIMGVVGENGAGKSTTIKIILNLIQPEEGSISIFGKDYKDESLKEDLGVVFDHDCFSEDLTAKKLNKVMSFAYERWDDSVFFRLLNRLNVPNDKKIKTFSRGMSMKLSIAIALSHNAKLLLLDEATSGLDPLVRDEILTLFQEFVEQEDRSVLLSSHITSDLEKIADYIIFLHRGKVILTENKDVLIYQYGIGKMKQADFETVSREDYISYRSYGLQKEILLENREEFARKYPGILVERGTIDEIFALLVEKEEFYVY